VNRTIVAVARFFFLRNACLYLVVIKMRCHQTDSALYHARISFSMNIKMISPQEIVLVQYRNGKKRPDEIEYNQLEGFVRQIIGWRNVCENLLVENARLC
jgi:deoxyribodipyrimidine photolyase-like uncharacterized protein